MKFCCDFSEMASRGGNRNIVPPDNVKTYEILKR